MRAAEVSIMPFFLAGQFGSLFCVSLAPAHGTVRGQILYLHPFTEEMHKSRRMAALQARRLAGAGFRVLQLDLTGCGDSWGDFSNARWETWLEDAVCAIAWLRGQDPNAPILLWGLRLGATLAVDLAARQSDMERVILWQPVINGELFLGQFLRLKLASEMLTEGRAQTGTRQLRERLKGGEPVEIGGYLLAPELAVAIGCLRLERMVPPRVAVWVEVVADVQTPIAPASQKVMNEWNDKGCALHSAQVVGEPFWNTQEITECPALLDATMTVLEQIAL